VVTIRNPVAPDFWNFLNKGMIRADFFFLAALEMEPRASRKLGKLSTTELHPLPQIYILL
jgi:hypothetical protein